MDFTEWINVAPVIVLMIIIVLVPVISALMNLFIAAIVLISKQVRIESRGAARTLLAQLGIIGFLTSATYLATDGLHFTKSNQLIPCYISGTVQMIIPPMSLFNIAGLNLDRYFAITTPLRYNNLVKPRTVLFLVIMAWIFTISLAIPPIFFTAYELDDTGSVCVPKMHSTVAFIYMCVYTVLTFFIPVGIVIFCNIKILMIARHHRHRIARAIFEVTLSAQVTITHQKNPFLIPQGGAGRHRSAISSIIQSILSLLICNGPNYTILLLATRGVEVPVWMHLTSHGLLYIGSMINGILYGIMNKLPRNAVNHYWRKKMNKKELNQEIQARTPSRRPSIAPQRVGQPSSTSALSQASSMPQSPLHSVTTASLSIPPKLNDPGTKERNYPTIIVTKPASKDDIIIEIPPTEQTHFKLGGSFGNLSRSTDQNEDCGVTMCHRSTTSLPARPEAPASPNVFSKF